MINRQAITKEYYEIFAGTDWPAYDMFVSGKYTVSQVVDDDIKKFLVTVEIQQKKHTSNSVLFQLKFFAAYVVPAIVGVIGFFAVGGTVEKFGITMLACVYINQFYNHTAHKWLTHRQFTPKWWIRPLMLWSITLIGNFKIGGWVICHKLHHLLSDTDRDPQLASVGIYKATVGIFPDAKVKPTEFIFDKKVHLPWKDVQFVDRYQNVLYCMNFLILLSIDLQVALLSLFCLRFYSKFYTAFSNYIIHGQGQNVAVNLPWYWELWFFGECLHKDHHDQAAKFDLSTPKRTEPSAKIWKYFVTEIKH